MTTTTKRRIVRSLLALAAAIALFVGVVGFAHTKHGRFLLAYIPGMGACPVGKPATPQQIDAARDEGRARLRGTLVATARPALGFDLDATRREDVLAWAAKHGVSCEEQTKKLTVTCRDVPTSALDGAKQPVEQLLLALDPEGRVTGVEAMRRTLGWDDAVELVDDRASAVAQAAGGAPERTGVADGAELAGGSLRRAQAELRCTTYRFIVSAVNQGGESPVVRERYQSIDESRM